ncbi:hypothetical protein KGMB02408_13570 [Bacteroides faecalis]|uniref:Uncharacterized protein n=1 Tax=Bacteroides faecalis TaxID=2447885 RepID=A0A401LS54_9BACE|nr:hypothetical protein KGMB02408_13570 [Bacteroides faecalis]
MATLIKNAVEVEYEISSDKCRYFSMEKLRTPINIQCIPKITMVPMEILYMTLELIRFNINPTPSIMPLPVKPNV